MTAPLSGKRVLVTRALEQADELIQRLSEAGAQVVHVPTIEFTAPDSWQVCDRAIERLSDYDWLVFSSSNGVRFFVQRLQERSKSVADLAALQIAAVGERTAGEIQALGLRVDLIPEHFSAEGLAAAFGDRSVRGKRILIVRAQEGRAVLEQELEKHGGVVDVAAVYKTRAPELPAQKDILNGNHIDVLIFTSPSTFKNLLARAGEERLRAWTANQCAIAAIGDVTAKAITGHGFEVDIVPEKSTAADLVESIVKFYGKRTATKRPTA